jgi:alpha,alpha-trehalase
MQFRLDIEKTLAALLAQEDTDGDKKITKEDAGPKKFTIASHGGQTYEVKGTYHLSNLLQELALEKKAGKTIAEIPLAKIDEAPTDRISRMIRDYFWNDLTRSIDKEGLSTILGDEKSTVDKQRLYVPCTDKEGRKYFSEIARLHPEMELVVLPKKITPKYVLSINDKPGILSLKIKNGSGVPFVVPGGRFNEMYGWDSYFEGVGLLLDDRLDLAKAMVDNFCYQIEHYGKILNANRTYYLTRTQPPFLSSFIREVFETVKTQDLSWLQETLETAIKEYETVWMVDGKRLTQTGLNRYFAEGIGVPPETEAGHFEKVLLKFAQKHGLSLEEFEQKYSQRQLVDEELDLYFRHDRSLRESGHDTSWRLDDCCADLNCVDLNALLYKYEKDFAYLIKAYFNNKFKTSKGRYYHSDYWTEKAATRKMLMNKYMWNEDAGCFFDYNLKTDKQTGFESATNFYPLWSGMCTAEQAEKMKNCLMMHYLAKGGILATSAASVSNIAKDQPQRQWDYPNGWAPHQMLIWRGLVRYGFLDEAQQCVYRWLWMITRNAVDYNGTIPEKYDVVACTHKVYAEYGNVGTEFDYITTSGFGWMNASYQLGLSMLSADLRNQLNQLTDPDKIF